MKALSEIARDVPPDQMVMEMAPGQSQTVDGASYWIVDPVKTAEAVNRLLETTSQTTSKVEVLNGSGISGAAKAVANRIEQSGFEVTSTRNAPSYGYASSQIIIHNAKATGAVELARIVGCTDIKNAPDGSTADGVDLTVIIGKDYRR
jgi:hypothetical protein